jgi:hypothetical protein
MIHLATKSSLLLSVLLLSSLAALGSPSQTSASEEVAVQVAQPIWTENGIIISSVTYIRWLGSPEPGIEVAWTARPDLVEREGDAKPSNRNAAALCGIEVRTRPKAKWKDWPREFADTLGVVLDLSRLAQRGSSRNHPEKQVVEATVDCILINAGRSRPAVKFVALEVEGVAKYGSLARIYPVSSTSRPRR